MGIREKSVKEPTYVCPTSNASTSFAFALYSENANDGFNVVDVV